MSPAPKWKALLQPYAEQYAQLCADPAPNPEGNVAARMRGGRLVGFVISRDRRPGPLDSFRFTPHYATCEAQKPKRKPETAPDPALF